MTPGARIQAAIELASRVAAGGEPADDITDDFFRQRRYAGSRDRRSIIDRLYGMLRRRGRIDWWIERTGVRGVDPSRGRVIADLALGDKLGAPEIDALFSGSRHCPPPLSDGERTLAEALAGRPIDHPGDMPAAVLAEIPGWLDTAFERAFGDRYVHEAKALNVPAPVDLRVNTLKSTWEDVRAALIAEQVTVHPTAYSPIALRIEGHVRLGGTSVFRDGLVEVQDEASQLVALLCDAHPGMTVVDFCAGAGGKTLALAAMMADERDNKNREIDGTLIACDVFSRRLQRMRARLHRAGAESVIRHTLTSEEDPWVEENAGIADRVLLDVPCTGSGTWRRHPEAKWRLRPEDLEDARSVQRRILANAAQLVKPGGQLIYATCSLLREENEDQTDWFTENVPGFAQLPVEDIWHAAVGGPFPPHQSGFGLRLSPASTGTDGFYCAIFERTA